MSFYTETGYSEVNGTKLYYEIAGEGKPIVLIHGNGADTRMWDDQFDYFAEHNRVLRYDARSRGKSAIPVEGVPYSHHNDLKELMKQLKIQKAHILGCSWGSGVAVDFVLTYPEMAYSLITVGPWAFGYDSPTARALGSVFGEVEALLKEKGAIAATDRWCDHIFAGALDLKGSKRIREICYDYSFWPFTHNDPVQYLDPSAIEQLDQISQPTLIITADRDLDACVEVADLMEEKIPDSRKVVLQDAGHGMNIDQPDEFNRLVLDFSKGL